MQRPEVRYADCGGAAVAYQVAGDGPLDLVFVPGFVSNLELWWDLGATRHFMSRLASFSRLVLFDKRGTGLSDPIDTSRPVEERIDEVLAVMDAAGAERAAVVGLSEGGTIAAVLAATHPQRVRSLVLVNSTPRFRAAPDWPHGWDDAFDREVVTPLLAGWGRAAEFADYWMPSVADRERSRRAALRAQRMSSSPGMVKAIFETMRRTDVRAALSAIRVPTLVLHADRDRVIPAAAGRAMAELIPGARFVTFVGRDHLPWVEGADAALDAIEEFLTGARAASEPDRVLATVLFADIARSTERAAALGDARWRALLADFHGEADRVVERWRGRRVKSLGDGLLATFDGPGRAVRSAHELAASVAELGLELRCGVHAGECEVVGDDLAGLAVHIGARVGALAGPGEVLATSTVRDLTAGSGIDWRDRGEAELRGVPGAWRLYAADAPRQSSS